MSDCWNRIGVWGKQPHTCEKLQHVIHCRNCDVYGKAGRAVMEKIIPADYLSLWTKTYSQATPAKVQKQQSVVVFRLGTEWFALPTAHCRSIENRSSIHSIPRHTQPAFLGVVNIRGTLQLCFSAGDLLQVTAQTGSSEAGIAVYKRLLVFTYDEETYVFPVDEVGGIERIDEARLENPPATLNLRQTEFIHGVIKSASRRIAMLNALRLFEALEETIRG